MAWGRQSPANAQVRVLGSPSPSERLKLTDELPVVALVVPPLTELLAFPLTTFIMHVRKHRNPSP